MENLLSAWKEFVRGKRKKEDVQEFQMRLMDNLFNLHRDLASGVYRHGGYHAFKVSDPKPRDIHKASVRDRLLHHAIHRKLYPFFDRAFIADSYSCRVGKGTHKALNRFRDFARKVSKNHTRTCWVLKCDIRKFFASIDQLILLGILKSHIPDKRTLGLLAEIVKSFQTHITPARPTGKAGVICKGLPLGNLTSQLLVNIYMNQFDQFVKHKLRAKYYIRYADDFVILSEDKSSLTSLYPLMDIFLRERLQLEVHPDKVSIRAFASGVDFLGWVHFPDHRVLRTATKRRMLRNCRGKEADDATVQSYLGLLGHGNTFRLKAKLYPSVEP